MAASEVSSGGSSGPAPLWVRGDLNAFFGLFINMLVNERIAEGTPEPKDGWTEVSRRPGLGITVDEKALGKPLFSIR